MKQVQAPLRNLPVVAEAALAFINRELLPVLRELRTRFNERHGEYAAKTANYTVTAADEFIDVDATAGAVTITLMDAADARCWVTVRKSDVSANAVTVSSADLINGVSTASFSTQYYAATFVSTGATYVIQSEYVP